MILSVFLSAALTVSVGAIAAAPTPAPLREIGRGNGATGICGNLVVHANSAIAAALRNDQIVVIVVSRLRAVDLESNALTRRNSLVELGRLAAELHGESLHGDDELKRLGELADQSGDGVHRADLQSFSDALEGAFSRQRRLASDIASFINFVDYNEMRQVTNPGSESRGSDSSAQNNNAIGGADAALNNSPYLKAGSPNRMARSLAVDLQGRTTDIGVDEAHAASHSEAAVTGCS